MQLVEVCLGVSAGDRHVVIGGSSLTDGAKFDVRTPASPWPGAVPPTGSTSARRGGRPQMPRQPPLHRPAFGVTTVRCVRLVVPALKGAQVRVSIFMQWLARFMRAPSRLRDGHHPRAHRRRHLLVQAARRGSDSRRSTSRRSSVTTTTARRRARADRDRDQRQDRGSRSTPSAASTSCARPPPRACRR